MLDKSILCVNLKTGGHNEKIYHLYRVFLDAVRLLASHGKKRSSKADRDGNDNPQFDSYYTEPTRSSILSEG
jgi:hypothetical protein